MQRGTQSKTYPKTTPGSAAESAAPETEGSGYWLSAGDASLKSRRQLAHEPLRQDAGIVAAEAEGIV